MHLHLEHTDIIGLIFLSCIEELYLVSLPDRSVHNLEVCDDTSERVEDRVEDKGLKRSFRIALRRRDPLDDGVKDLLHTITGLSRCTQAILRLAADKIHYLIGNDIDHGRLDIDLVKHRNDFEVMLDRKVKI